MALYRDQVTRISVRVLRARFTPRAWKTLKSVRVEHQGLQATIALIRRPAPGLRSGWRTAMSCPRCNAVVDVIGCVPRGVAAPPGWCCGKCGEWRGRPRRLVVTAADLHFSHDHHRPEELPKTELHAVAEEAGAPR